MNMLSKSLPALRGPYAKPIYDAETIIYRLEEAGRTLLSLPNAGCFPAGIRTYWPQGAEMAAECWGYGLEEGIRPAPPTSVAITRMDEAMRWVNLIAPDKRVHRRIVLMRALVNPRNERHIWSFRKIGRALGFDHKAGQRWHDQGIDWIAQGLYGQQLAGDNWAILWQEERRVLGHL
jgi:hypothetical protein